MTRNSRLILVAWMILQIAPVSAGADARNKGTELSSDAQKSFLRVRRDDHGEPMALESAIVRYTPDDSSDTTLTVDLIAAVHLADSEYYEQLNRRFRSYDVVLYELIAREGTVIPKGGSGARRHPVGMIQGKMKSLLDLSFQLEAIDYTRPNLVRADMSPEEFSKSMSDRGESFLQLFFRLMGQAMAMQGGDLTGSSDLETLSALFAPDRHLRLKRIMAKQFEEFGGTIPGLDGPDGSTIVTERNAKAVEVLKQQIAAGNRKIAIFYGAGHMPDMQRRLLADLRLRRKSHRWLVCWNLESSGAPTANDRANDENGED